MTAQDRRTPATTAEELLWKIELLKQAVRGIVHRGVAGDIVSVDDESLPVEDVLDELKAEVENFIPVLLKAEKAEAA